MPAAEEPRTARADRTEWDAFRCRRCQKLLFKATVALLTELTRDQRLEIKCACKTMNYLMGA
jgi:phage FluMu protein Com